MFIRAKARRLKSVKPQCTMTDFDMSEITAVGNTWPEAVILCTVHAIAGPSKWINRNTPKAYRKKLQNMFKELHFCKDEKDLRTKMANLKRFCTVKGLGNVKQYLVKSWEPFIALEVQFYRNDFWSGQSNTNNISEGRVGSFKKGLKNVTDGSIFSAVKYLLETYIPNDIQDFKALNRNHA